jgi:hypothetical protein
MERLCNFILHNEIVERGVERDRRTYNTTPRKSSYIYRREAASYRL